MADFDWSKYEKVKGAPQSSKNSGDFDWSQYEQVNSAPSNPFPPGYGTSIPEEMAKVKSTFEDVGRGAREFAQNTGAFVTQKLPEGLHITRYTAQPHTSYGRLPIEAGKVLASLPLGAIGEAPALAGLARAGINSNLLRGAVSGIGAGAVTAPGFDLSPLEGAAYGGGIGAIAGIPGALLNRMRGRSSLEEFNKAREAVPDDIKAPIGELADSERAKNWYAKTRAVAGSGADTPYFDINQKLSEGIGQLTGDEAAVSNPGALVFEDMEKNYLAAKKQTDDAYKELAEYMDTNNIPLDATPFKNAINNSIKEVTEAATNPSIKRDYAEILGMLKGYKKDPLIKPKTKKNIENKISNTSPFAASEVSGVLERYKEPLPETPLNMFKSADRLRRQINKKIKATPFDDLEAHRYLQIMKDGLDKSLASAAAKDGRALELHNAARNARINQGGFENLNLKDKTPFYKLFSKGGEPEKFIADNVRTGTRGADYSPLLKALTDRISPESRDILTSEFINPRGEATLAKQLSNLRSLSPAQRDLLLGEDSPLATNLLELSNLFPEAANAGFVPKTGYTAGKIKQAADILAHGLAGYGGGSLLGHPMLGLASVGALPVGAQAIQRALRSNWLKDAYAKQLAGKGAKKLTSGNKERLARALLSDTMGGNQ